MTIEELVKYSPFEVRKNKQLFEEYIRLYEKTEGKKPDCAGCSFSGTFSKWVQRINHKNTIKMSTANNTFKLKVNKPIYIPFSGGKVITESSPDKYVWEYLNQVKDGAREKREANFTKLPDPLKKNSNKSKDEKPAETTEIEKNADESKDEVTEPVENTEDNETEIQTDEELAAETSPKPKTKTKKSTNTEK